MSKEYVMQLESTIENLKRDNKLLKDKLKVLSKLGTVNALTYIQKGLEAYKMVELPFLSNDGKTYMPYAEDGEVRTFVDFMLVYLDEAIKMLDKKDKSE